MRALLYLRNSSDRQAKAATIEAQRPPCRELAARLGATALVEYAEPAVSGAAPLHARPAMQRLLDEVRQGDLVLAFALDRLSRSDDQLERAAIYGRLQRVGALVETVCDGKVDSSTMAGRIMHAIREEVAAEERKKILARTTAGKARAASLGRKPQGRTPYGLAFDKENGWTIDEPAAAVVREIYRRLVAGETCGQIGADLARRRAHHQRPAGWDAKRVWQIATRPTYKGEWMFEGRAIAVPAIVDGASWRTVQAQLLAAGKRGLRRTQRVYLLDQGTGRCGYCGGPLHVRWGGTGGVTSYYLCPRRACGLGWRRAELVDREVWERVAAALQRRDLVAEAVGEGAEEVATGEGDAAGFERRLQRLGEVEKAILARFRRGIISEAAMEAEAATIARERSLLEQSAAAARQAASRARTRTVAAAELRQALAAVAERLGQLDPAGRREAVRALRVDARLERDKLLISFELRPSFPALAGPVGVVPSSCSCRESHCETEKGQGIRVVA